MNKDVKVVLKFIAKAIVVFIFATTALYLLQKPGFVDKMLGYVSTVFAFVDHMLSFKAGGVQ